jgi:hypothetical protein
MIVVPPGMALVAPRRVPSSANQYRTAMPDDPPRPASGQQPDPRPTAGAPAWWGALGRPDLPLDGGVTPHEVHVAPPAHMTGQKAPTAGGQRRWRLWVLNAVVLLIVALIVSVGLGALSLKMFVTVALVFGVPVVLAAVTATVMARHSR